MKKTLVRAAAVLLLAVCVAIGIMYFTETGIFLPYDPSDPVNDESRITVALFPYLPDVQLMQDLVTERWAKIQPGVQLEFVDWDCYVGGTLGYAAEIDVIMYDVLFMSALVEQGYVQPIDASSIADKDDILDFALDGSKYNDVIYGIPFLGCSFFLIYDKDDTEIDAVNTFSELYEVLGARTADTPYPAGTDEGLILNFINDAPYYYLDALIDHNGEFTEYPEAPSFAQADERVMDTFDLIRTMAGQAHINQCDYFSYEHALFENAYQFGLGQGRALYGYSEDLAFMPDRVDDLTLKTISFSEEENIPLFFADVLSVNSRIQNKKKTALCLELMNMIGSKEFIYDYIQGSGSPQYTLPVHKSLYPRLAETIPVYERLSELVANENNRLLRFGPDVYDYLNESFEYFTP